MYIIFFSSKEVRGWVRLPNGKSHYLICVMKPSLIYFGVQNTGGCAALPPRLLTSIVETKLQLWCQGDGVKTSMVIRG